MKKWTIILSISLISIPLTACFLGSFGPLPMDVNRKNEYLEYSWGGIVKDCQGKALGAADNLMTKRFWDQNHLPRGTIDFVCVNGKAYLPGQQPKAK
ncbi:hypothetical protein [Acinetobacter rudis]|uniref:hypothetical protein n=1 Tax=Acinetobacter rudis TaxID=632955 RepID=UPI003340874D